MSLDHQHEPEWKERCYCGTQRSVDLKMSICGQLCFALIQLDIYMQVGCPLPGSKVTTEEHEVILLGSSIIHVCRMEWGSGIVVCQLTCERAASVAGKRGGGGAMIMWDRGNTKAKALGRGVDISQKWGRLTKHMGDVAVGAGLGE